MSNIRVETVTLPAFLASALVNGDTSSFDNGTPEQAADDMAWLERVERYIAPGFTVSMEGEAYFGTCHVGGRRFVGNVAEYVIYYLEAR